MPGGIRGKHPHLTIFDLAQRPTVLPRDPYGVRALFDKACLIKHQDASRIAHLLSHELMVVPPHLLLIPVHITDKPLHPPDGAALDVERHRLNRLPFQLTELAHHLVKEMGAWLTARKTVMKDRLKLPQFLHEPFDIAGDHVKWGNGKSCTFGPTGW
jgi:hypothetical protein